ncbi:MULTISPECIES: SDR family oxidoreductase [Paenarthrobacter]|uniref:SDR family oxidoreductase n=1 Tax=Paenarthrobacter TaxID=1742992 RepID=UPI00074D2C89|nr:SDR family oxidoreductase [Paenarthrobacter ureafaciens]AMB40466.1 short-chain dehydrogenase [Arthrobacter sp. ATCC 21022]KUR65042.1 short-chain dehydrogenase [Arthrobacter sp. ATCC 21022]RWW99900.1 SDR family oxidoreductase [Paenarthrobacter ureafaciens]
MTRLVVVTGSGRGLGFDIAERLARAGDRIVIAEKNADLAERAAATLHERGLDVTAVVTDIADKASVEALATAVRQLGGADALVNNAALADGVGGDTFWELEEGFFQRVMTVNAYGTWLVSKHLFPQLAQSPAGAIVNIASDAALYGSPRLVHYVGSKGAVLAMTRSMARDAGPSGVRVNAVAPGLTRVEATESVPASRYRLYEDNRVLPRDQQPNDVSGVVQFLLSDAAGFVTGQTIVVDGGFVMGH